MRKLAREEAIERFWARTDRSGPPHPTLGTPCWIWTGSRHPSGYGYSTLGRAHRVAHELAIGPIPTGHEILHLCDVPACINPAHLRSGTHAENMADMAEKGRAGNRGMIPLTRVLTDAQVVEMREMYAAGASLRTCANRFGVALRTVGRAVQGHFWKRAGGPITTTIDVDARRPRGSATARSKLTEDQVREMRAAAARGERQCDLAVRFGISRTNVNAIIHRRFWKHVA